MIVGVTGGNGFLGWHLRVRLLAAGIQSMTATRETFASEVALDEFVSESEVLVHVAGVNRASSDDEITSGNISLAESLVAAARRTSSDAPILYTSSTQIDRDNAYGRAKAKAGEVLQSWCAESGTAFANVVLPHLFGEFGRENYNSAVTTFAFCLATGEQPSINRDGALELLHAQDVSQWVVEWLQSPTSINHRMAGRTISVGEVWDLLQAQHERYSTDLTVPAFENTFELQVFNTLRSQLYRAGHYPIPITLHGDERGAFAELCRSDGTGQTSVSTSFPGVQRGDHFHFDKIERFVVVAGQAEIKVRRLLTDELQTFTVSGSDPVAIDMPPLCTHNIRNTGDDIMTTIFWAGDHFDPANPDTFVEPVKTAL